MGENPDMENLLTGKGDIDITFHFASMIFNVNSIYLSFLLNRSACAVVCSDSGEMCECSSVIVTAMKGLY